MFKRISKEDFENLQLLNEMLEKYEEIVIMPARPSFSLPYESDHEWMGKSRGMMVLTELKMADRVEVIKRKK